MVEVAWAASRSKGTFYKARYHRLAARRGKKKAIVAVAHSVLKSVYHVLKNQVSYKELGADYLNNIMEDKRAKYLKRELNKLGYNVQKKQEKVSVLVNS